MSNNKNESDINIANLSIGSVIKNYKELCGILEEKVLDGKSRRLQIENWKRYFDFERQGNKYIIKEIYPTPLPKDFSKNDVYTKYVQVILTRCLKETHKRYFTTTDLLKLFGFVNDNWGNLDLLNDYCKESLCSPKQATYYYNQLYMHVMSYCTTAFKRCLNRLSQRKYILYEEVFVQNINGEIRELTNKEKQTYTDISYALKREMGIKLINIYNAERYYSELNERLKEVGLENVYKTFHIFPAKNGINEAVEISIQEFNDAKLNVNDTSLEQMKKYVDIDINKDINKLTDKYNKIYDKSDEDIQLMFTKEQFSNAMVDSSIDIEKSFEDKLYMANMYVDISNML